MASTLLHTPADAVRFLSARASTGLATDSRRLRPGEAFLAWAGRSHDARQHVPAALAAGASACLVDDDGLRAEGDDARIGRYAGLKAAAGPIASLFHGQPSARLSLVAATGTNGKTSTSWWTAQALTALGRRAGFIGTLGVGEPPAAGSSAGADLQSTGLTTPDAVTLQRALADFVDRGFAACAFEASSIGMAEQRLAGTQVAVALFTNLTRDHLDYHGDMQAYGAAKRALFTLPGLGAAVINIDDAFGATLAAELAAGAHAHRLPLWTVSLHSPARLQAQKLRYEGDGLAFDLHEDGAVHTVRSALVGDYNASNLLLVIGGLRALGLPLADIAAVVPRLTPVPGRLQPVPAPGPGLPAVLVDYAHTPDALQQLLRALRPMATARGGRLWCVFGCGGNRDASKRPLMGAIAAQQADAVVLTSDNPRDEQPAQILAQIEAGIARRDHVRVIEDRGAAIALAVASAAPADVLVLAGKGHETYQETAGQRRLFDDAAEAARALQQRWQQTPGAAA